MPICEPGLAELVAPTASGCTSRPSSRRRARARAAAVRRRRHAADVLRRRRPLARSTPSSTRCPPSDRHALVMKSTVPVGTGGRSSARFAEQGKGGFRYVSCPEFLKEGSAVKDFLHPDRVVVGDDGDWAGDAVVELYAPLDAPLVRTDITSAEMVKLASNAFLATKISFINEIANVCEETGADVVEVARGMGLDDRIGPKFLQAGIGFGGSCFPKDVTRAQAARRQLRLPLPAAERGDRGQRAAEAARDRQAREAPRLAGRQGDRAARPGLQARTPTTCARRPRSCSSARLQADGRARARVRPGGRGRGAQADPRRRLRRRALEAVDGADAVVLVTEWPEFARARLARDGRARCAARCSSTGATCSTPTRVRAAGFAYEGIGAAPRSPAAGEAACRR